MDIAALGDRLVAVALLTGGVVASAAALMTLPKPAAPHSAFDRPSRVAPRPVDVDVAAPARSTAFHLHPVACGPEVPGATRCWLGTSPSTRG